MRHPAKHNTVLYRGRSMAGTFRVGDRLIVDTTARLPDILAGDVVVFESHQPHTQSKTVVHRVMKVVPGGLVVRGDNTSAADCTVILEEQIMGTVTQRIRDGTARPVTGGRWGLVRARIQHVRFALRWWRSFLLKRIIFPRLRPLYRAFRRSGIVRRVWRPHVTKITVQSEDGPLVKYVVRGKTVVQWWPQRRRYHARRPYDLIIPPPIDGHDPW